MRKERSGDTLQATALVHEVFLRLVEVERVSWQDRAHFLAVSANMMRRLLVDRARARGASKRGEGAVRVPLEGALELASDTADRDLAAIDDALQTLAKIDPRKEKVVALRFFGGLSVEETAVVLKISPQSVASCATGKWRARGSFSNWRTEPEGVPGATAKLQDKPGDGTPKPQWKRGPVSHIGHHQPHLDKSPASRSLATLCRLSTGTAAASFPTGRHEARR